MDKESEEAFHRRRNPPDEQVREEVFKPTSN